MEPLLNLVFDRGKVAVLIPEENQISVEHITPHFDAEPCDLCKYRKNLDEQNHHHGRVSAKHLQVTPFHIDPACGCNFIKRQEWHPDNWSMLVEQKQQQHIQGYEMIYLFWPHKSYHISHIDPSRQEIQVVDPYYFIDIPDPKELSPEQKNLMIFDDLLLHKQNKCEAYYVRGRHSNCDCLYVSQNYCKLPCQTVVHSPANLTKLYQRKTRL